MNFGMADLLLLEVQLANAPITRVVPIVVPPLLKRGFHPLRPGESLLRQPAPRERWSVSGVDDPHTPRSQVYPMSSFAAFLVAASLLAIMPGPGLLFVFSRTIAGGREHGLRTVVGTMCGGMVHVVAGAVGLSA